MFDAPGHTVVIDARHGLPGNFLHLRLCVAHRNGKADRLHHLDVIDAVAKRKAFGDRDTERFKRMEDA